MKLVDRELKRKNMKSQKKISVVLAARSVYLLFSSCMLPISGFPCITIKFLTKDRQIFVHARPTKPELSYVHRALTTLYRYIFNVYSKVPKFSDTKNLCCKLPKIRTKRQNLRLFCQNGAKGIANSEDPDQTAPLGAVWSGSALFAQAYVSENLGSLR